MTQLPYRGVQFDVGEHSYIVPAITVNQAEQYATEIDTAQSLITDAVREAAVQTPESWAAFKASLRAKQAAMKHIITLAMKRNYPDITDADIDNFVDVGNVVEVFNAAMGLTPGPKVRAPVSNGAGNPSTSAGATSTGGESKLG